MNSKEREHFGKFDFRKTHQLYFCERSFTSSYAYDLKSLEIEWLEMISKDKIIFKREIREEDIKKIIYNFEINYYYFFTETKIITYEYDDGRKKTFEGRLCLVWAPDIGSLDNNTEVRFVKEESISDGIRKRSHLVKDINFGTLTKAAK